MLVLASTLVNPHVKFADTSPFFHPRSISPRMNSFSLVLSFIDLSQVDSKSGHLFDLRGPEHNGPEREDREIDRENARSTPFKAVPFHPIHRFDKHAQTVITVGNL